MRLEVPLLTDKEKELTEEWQGEFQFIGSIYQTPGLLYPAWSSLNKFLGFNQKIIFKPNAAINQYFHFYKDIIEWSRLPADRLLSAKQNAFSGPDFWDVGYNPVGVILNNISFPDFERYIYRLHDLDCLVRLVKIKQQIRSNRIAKDQVENFLKQDAAEFKNPYTNQPVIWDAKSEILYFNSPSEEGKKIEIKVPFLK
jgi:hypothetical protein